MQQKAWVGFAPEAEIWWLRFLKKGYRHCFVCIKSHDQWVIIDPLSRSIDIEIIAAEKVKNLPRYLAQQGYKVYPFGSIENTKKTGRIIGYLSCVTLVKKTLGLSKPFIFTPYQLARYLEKRSHQDGKNY